tara:strand:+ start:1200 stop:1367 length:168 start_codon:yes stop_codon:yes gene_type:complete
MKKLFLFFFLIGCVSTNQSYNTNKEIFDFNKKLTFNEFNELLIRYSENAPYGNID